MKRISLSNISEISRESMFVADYRGMKIEFEILQTVWANEPTYLIHTINDSYKFSNELEKEILDSIQKMKQEKISFLWKKLFR